MFAQKVRYFGSGTICRITATNHCELNFSSEIGPLDYDTTIRQMIPDLENRNSMNLNLPKLPLLEKIVYYSNTENISGTILWSDLEKAGQSSDFRKVDELKIDVDSTANIQFTSGTTGMPKVL